MSAVAAQEISGLALAQCVQWAAGDAILHYDTGGSFLKDSFYSFGNKIKPIFSILKNGLFKSKIKSSDFSRIDNMYSKIEIHDLYV